MPEKSTHSPRGQHGGGKFWILGGLVASLVVSGYFSGVYDKFLGSNHYYVCSNSENIYTVNEAQPRVQCFLVRNSVFVDSGSFNEIETRRRALFAPYVPAWALPVLSRTPHVYRVKPDSIVVPGLTDAHAHILDYGFTRQLPLAGSQSVQEVIDKIKAFIRANPDVENDKSKWIEGMGWDQTKWPGGQFPTADDLDQDPLLKGRPISLARIDVHAKWVSPRVLELMGELPDTVDGGEIVRTPSGKPTGIMIDNAMNLIPAPAWSEDQMSRYFETTMKDALAHGLTSIHDAASLPHYVQFFKKRAEEGRLPNRLYIMGSVPDYKSGSITRLSDHGPQGRLNLRSMKIFMDGALGSWGAALLAPYADKPDTSGTLLSEPEKIANITRQLFKDGLQANIHCIGDRANHVVLDILEDIIKNEGAKVDEWRPRIEHSQIFTPEDLRRMSTLGIIPSVQPTHATSDMGYAESRLGPGRIKGAYAYRTLLETSSRGVLPIGSDFPVESINPLFGFYAAVTRLDHSGNSPHGPGGWFPAERLTRAQALKGMTLDATYASFAEDTIGSISPGKKADFVILDKDIMTVPFADILETKVMATVIDTGGKSQRSDFDTSLREVFSKCRASVASQAIVCLKRTPAEYYYLMDGAL